jgi:predicted small secreted protein
MARKILLIVALLVMVVSLVGCQTVQGVGRDITWTAEAGAEVVEGALN